MKGEHLFIRKEFYTHHGIDAGDGTVIHWNLPGEDEKSLRDKKRARIIQTSMESFLKGGELCRVAYPGPGMDPEDVVGRARSRLGEKGYHLLFNNCEHFANWCVTGKPLSGQIHSLRKKISGIPLKQSVRVLVAKKCLKSFSRQIAGKITPWMVLSDLAAATQEIYCKSRGKSPEVTRKRTRMTGLGVSLGMGTLMGGVLGAGLGVSFWAAGELTSGAGSLSVKKLLKYCHGLKKSE